MNEIVNPPYFNFSEEDGDQCVNLVDVKTQHMGKQGRNNLKVDVDNDMDMGDDNISMICEIQPDKQDQSQYQIIS